MHVSVAAARLAFSYEYWANIKNLQSFFKAWTLFQACAIWVIKRFFRFLRYITSLIIFVLKIQQFSPTFCPNSHKISFIRRHVSFWKFPIICHSCLPLLRWSYDTQLWLKSSQPTVRSFIHNGDIYLALPSLFLRRQPNNKKD